jgi:hypothetical protein
MKQVMDMGGVKVVSAECVPQRLGDASPCVEVSSGLCTIARSKNAIVVTMQTTVSLEPDVQRMLEGAVKESGRSFDEVLNDAIRVGLKQATESVPAFTQRVFSMGPASVDLRKAGALAAELEDERTIARHHAARRTPPRRS